LLLSAGSREQSPPFNTAQHCCSVLTAPSEKHMWAVQACHENIPMATMNNKGIL